MPADITALADSRSPGWSRGPVVDLAAKGGGGGGAPAVVPMAAGGDAGGVDADARAAAAPAAERAGRRSSSAMGPRRRSISAPAPLLLRGLSTAKVAPGAAPGPAEAVASEEYCF